VNDLLFSKHVGFFCLAGQAVRVVRKHQLERLLKVTRSNPAPAILTRKRK